MFKVYVDGQHGTTGLLVHERLEKHPMVQLLEIPFEERHNLEHRKQLLNEADVVFLCLPDEAAKESVQLITNPKTKIIDASTAHRTNKDWAYGFTELSKEHLEAVKTARYISNPGCHATASISLLYPLIQEGVLSGDEALSMFSITGYSGGGKQMISTYETTDNKAYKAPRQYALGLSHKHVPEIMARAGVTRKPIFMPIVSNYKRGLAVTIPLHRSQLAKNISRTKLVEIYQKFYGDKTFVHVYKEDSEEPLVDNCMDIQMCNDTNNLDVMIYGNEEQILLIARLDNLGKGASGAAIQNMNIMLGIHETTGLV